jgi:ribonuclease-3
VRYRVIQEEGPDHEKMFEVAVIFREKEFGRGRGRSKKQAEQAAAKSALDGLQRTEAAP